MKLTKEEINNCDDYGEIVTNIAENRDLYTDDEIISILNTPTFGDERVDTYYIGLVVYNFLSDKTKKEKILNDLKEDIEDVFEISFNQG